MLAEFVFTAARFYWSFHKAHLSVAKEVYNIDKQKPSNRIEERDKDGFCHYQVVVVFGNTHLSVASKVYQLSRISLQLIIRFICSGI